MLPNEYNEKGYFENDYIVKANDHILQTLGSSWDDLFLFEDEWWRMPQLIPHIDAVKKIIQQEFSTSRLFCIKDPRISILLPFWISILQELNIEPFFIIPLRHPLEVAESLKTRDGFSIQKGLLLWMNNMLSIEYYSRPSKRIFLKFDDFLTYPTDTLHCIFNQFNIDFPNAGSPFDVIAKELLDPKLKHHNIKELNFASDTLSLIDRFYEILLHAHNSTEMDENVLTDIDKIRAEYKRLSSLFYNQDIRKASIIHKTSLDLKRQIDDLNQIAIERDSQIADLRQSVAKRDAQIVNLHRSVAERDGQISELISSTSWQITLPLRIVGQQLKRFQRAVDLAGPAIQRGGGLKSTITKAMRLYRHEGLPGIKRGFRMLATSVPYRIPQNDTYSEESLAQMKALIDSFEHKPLISVVMPTYNTKPEWLNETIETVRNQVYPYWELCIADGGSGKETKDCLLQWQKLDQRIKVVFLEENKGIAGNSIEAYAIAHGDYIILLDHDDCLSRDALMEVVLCINKNSEADFIYSDKAVFSDETKEILAYHCLPGFSPDLLRSCNYASHLTAFSRFIIDEVGFLKQGYDGSQDYEFELRVIEKARKILNIPKVLYFSRAGQGSVALNPESKMYAYEAGRKAIEEHIKRIGYEGDVEFMRATYSFRIHYKIKGNPLVSIIIPNKDHKQDLKKCIDSIMTGSTYRNYEIIIVENNSETDDIFEYYDALKNVKEIKIIKITGKEFNFSAINNYAVQCAEGEHVLLLNNDTEVITPHWIEEMLAFSQREDVGAVGAKLYYADNRIQHAGLVIGLTRDIASHYHHGNDRRHTGYMHRLTMPQNYCAVTGACLMVKKRLYLEVGGMDEINFKIGLNDVDFCLKLRETGKINVWTPYAELYHYESVSRGLDKTPEKSARLQSESLFFRNKWKLYFEQGDPYHNAGIVC
ncbi:MAG: glycosyltransferase [Smithella sp.]